MDAQINAWFVKNNLQDLIPQFSGMFNIFCRINILFNFYFSDFDFETFKKISNHHVREILPQLVQRIRFENVYFSKENQTFLEQEVAENNPNGNEESQNNIAALTLPNILPIDTAGQEAEKTQPQPGPSSVEVENFTVYVEKRIIDENTVS